MLIDLHERALGRTVALANLVRTEYLSRATPCAGWTMGDLLAHMVGQNLGFAAAASGDAPDVSAYAPRDLGDDPAQTYAASADAVAAAFRAAFEPPGGLDADVYLAEVRGGTTVPGRLAVQFHLVDCVVHGWDVARTVGHPVDLDDEVLIEALRVAEAVPDSSKATTPGAPFAPSVATPSTELLDRIVAVLGRDPAWSPA